MLAVALSLACAGLPACQGPCEDLAQLICECETRSQLEANACFNRLVISRSIELTEAQEDRCKQDLKRCQCDDLRLGKQADCGLAFHIGDLPNPDPGVTPSASMYP
ncbi:MAG: hypothetical protein GMKNLPBB_02763 [Myxococcota bacterium]|nr:hypothetical protein [Myxococcota bacterium]